MFVTKRTMNRREFLRIGGTGLAGAVLLGSSGCAGEQGSEKRGGENAIGWQAIPAYSLEAPEENRVEYIQNAISSWEEASGSTIDPLVTSSNVTEAMALLLEQASQGRAPDLAMVDSYIFPRFYEYVRPVGEYLDDISLDDYFPFIREIMTGPEGEVMGMQFTTDVRVMYYRRDLIPTPPASWDELLRTGRDLLSEDEELTPYVFPAGRDEATVTTSLFPYFWASGGELVDGEGNPAFGEGENREAMLGSLGFIQECVESGVTPRRVTDYGQETDLNGDVASGQTAMFLGGNWQVPQLKEIIGAEQFVSQWDVAPIPSSEGGDNHATTAGGWVWGVFTDDEEKQRAGVDFLKSAFVGDQGMAGWCNVGGYLPPRQSVFETPEYQGNEYTDTFREHLSRYARNRPAAEAYQDISTALQVAVGQVVSGEASPEQALETAVRSVSG
jgi:multiple sugar transport system substrate-binding protein